MTPDLLSLCIFEAYLIHTVLRSILSIVHQVIGETAAGPVPTGYFHEAKPGLNQRDHQPNTRTHREQNDMELDSWAGPPDGSMASSSLGVPPGGLSVTRGAVDAANESKRDKRRREMAIKVERIRQETIDRKDSIHADLQESYRIHLSAMLSLPYPTHPEYLLRLHALSVQRDADTLAARLESTYALETARQLYHSEVDRVEEEYESAKKAIKEKLLEACDERAKKLKEEKDSLELPSLEGGLYGDNGKHQTRRRGVNGFAASSPAVAGSSTGGHFHTIAPCYICRTFANHRCYPSQALQSPALLYRHLSQAATPHLQEGPLQQHTTCSRTSPHHKSAIHSTILSYRIHQHSPTTLFILLCFSYNQVQMPYFKVSKQDITIIVLLAEEQKLVIHLMVLLLRLVLMLYWARVSMLSISLELRRSRMIWSGSESGRGREEPVPRHAKELRRDTLYRITSLILYKMISLYFPCNVPESMCIM